MYVQQSQMKQCIYPIEDFQDSRESRMDSSWYVEAGHQHNTKDYREQQ